MLERLNNKNYIDNGVPFRRQAVVDFSLQEQEIQNSLSLANDKEANILAHQLQKFDQFKGISSAKLFGMNLLTRAYRLILANYLHKLDPKIIEDMYEFLETQLGKKQITEINQKYGSDFLISENPELSDLIVIWLCNENPAFIPFQLLFSDAGLRADTKFVEVIENLRDFFSEQPKLLDNFSLFEILTLAFEKFPFSIYEQLSFIRTNFTGILDELLWSVLLGIDILQEENTFRGGGPGPTQVYDFNSEDIEYERFSEDQTWMASLVLIAKSTYVWLAQLSRKYNREIKQLDQIPDEELQYLAAKGFNGLWLIGIWERSFASKKFKQLKGNSDAIASAYSLKNYHVAQELGGDEAMRNLQRNAWKFGMRIGCDMVPNHMGIDSDWLAQHPDWFLQADEPPFPAYQFHSQNISNRDEIEVFIEDHYYDETDAAVVFKLHDKRDNRTRFVYHGNDGTSFPWNDTAQLNYILPEVREAVIKEIVEIAKFYPVIRFDAAMTLAKKHIRRLWFPQQGSGGDIPSRARYAISDEEFNLQIPNEFWREVVDRVAQEAPDTLLLAEAFWMMEGYFVRTLGMHRVYNSAFMNMLKAEENAKYRDSIKNILDFNPQILKRFVNFMSNPDEDTAISQFGTDDKYFGVCVLMATMPGLPMFAHGQIEGFTERYGMEYSRPRHWEDVNEALLNRHETEVFPLIRNRKLFAEVDNFILYDFITDDGNLNKNVFAYSNEVDGQRSLVVYHNVFQETSGSIHQANKPVLKDGKVEWQPTSLAKAWHLHNLSNWFTIFTDSISGQTFVRRSSDLHNSGLHVILSAFKYSVFWQVQEIEDKDGMIEKLFEHLQMKGTANLAREMKRLEFNEMLNAFNNLLSIDLIKQIQMNWINNPDKFMQMYKQELIFRFGTDIADLMQSVDLKTDPNISVKICNNIQNILKISPISFTTDEQFLIIISGFIEPLTEHLITKFGDNWLEESQIKYEVLDLLQKISKDTKPDNLAILALIIELHTNLKDRIPSEDWLQELMQKPQIINYLQINEFEKIIWYNHEALEQMMNWMKIIIPIAIEDKKVINRWDMFVELLLKIEAKSEFKVENLIDLLKKEWKYER
jgi:glycosidase